MPLRTIMIFPKFDHMEIIEEIRKEYDPLFHLVKPHITLVFPFEDEITDADLENKLEKCLENMKSFRLVLHGIEKQENAYGHYLFLKVTEGVNELIKLHDMLYSGLWGTAIERKEYFSHMTIGKLSSTAELNTAFSKIETLDDLFETVVRTVSVEMIGKNGESIIIIEKQLH